MTQVLFQVMKPVHTYHVPTYSIVPPYQFARFQKIETPIPFDNPHCRYHTLGKRATPEEETAEFLNNWVDFKVLHFSHEIMFDWLTLVIFRVILSTRLET